MREETSSIESDAEDEFCTKQAHSRIPRLMADDVHLNVAPSLKVRVSKQPSSLAKSICEQSFSREL